MKRIFEWIGGFALIAFSFYFTDQVSLLVANKSDLMKEIKAVSEHYREEAVDAVIDTTQNTIIPGAYGREVDDRESYLSMHEFGAFNENYLIYNFIKPNTSLQDNKDKYITRGNGKNRYIGLIVAENESVLKYLQSREIKFDLLAATSKEMESDSEYINIASNAAEFKTLNSKIAKDKKLCLKDYSDLASCLKNGYYIIDAELKLQANNVSEIKKHISSGTIILITSSAPLEHVKLILNEAEYKDLEPVYLSELISEK